MQGEEVTAWIDCDAQEPKELKRAIPSTLSREGLVFIGRDLLEEPLFTVSYAKINVRFRCQNGFFVIAAFQNI